MKRTFAILASSVVVLTAHSTRAQAGAADKKFLVAVDGTIALPVGNLSNASGLGIGAMVTGEYLYQEQITFTGRTGYEFHLNSNGAHMNVLPVMAGARYYIEPSGTHQGIFGLGELGFNDLMSTVDVPGVGSASASSIYFGLGVGGGYQRGPIDFQAKLQVLDIGHIGDSLEIAALVGYQFAAF